MNVWKRKIIPNHFLPFLLHFHHSPIHIRATIARVHCDLGLSLLLINKVNLNGEVNILYSSE